MATEGAGDAPEGTPEWRPIDGWAYDVSSDGRVRRRPGTGRTGGQERALHPGGGRQGEYLRVNLSRPGQTKTFNVHVLVAIAFHGDRRAEGLTVDHIDDDPENNAASNLRWMNGSRNSRDGSRKRWDARGLDVPASERRPGDPF